MIRKSALLLFYDENTRKAELLLTPLKNLGVKITDGLLGECLRRVKERMEEEGFVIRPRFYLGTEYSCVMGTANISLGFWDADEILRDLYYTATGVRLSREDIVAVIWHEVGHAFCYMYKLYRISSFRRIFGVKGNFFQTYPQRNYYRPNPWSKNYVNLTGDHYAQKHPDDDFAETFAAVMLYGRKWRSFFRGKPGALIKLRFVEETIRNFKRKPPVVDPDCDSLPDNVESMDITLSSFLHLSPRRYIKRAEGYIDPLIKKVFKKVTKRSNGMIGLEDFIKRYKRVLVDRISKTTGVKRGVVMDVLRKFEERGTALELGLKREEELKKLLELTSVVSSLAERFKERGRFRK